MPKQFIITTLIMPVRNYPLSTSRLRKRARSLAAVGVWMLFFCFNIFSASASPLPDDPVELPDSIPYGPIIDNPGAAVVDEMIVAGRDSATLLPLDTVPVMPASKAVVEASKGRKVFNPDPTRAVWLSALFPGLGQIYNRRYWKLPIVIGAYMALGYGTQWNNMMLSDYTKAYNDLTDSDPNTNSYMDFYPPTVSESDLDKQYLERSFKARKDYCRRNRDLCIIAMVGVYLVAMVDAYVDASLAHFDITPDLSIDWSPAIIPDTRSQLPGVGLQWALTF